jgi:hypothetical protein
VGFRDSVRKNTPKVELHSIMSLVAGGYKSGKTRLWKEITELHYPNNPDAALLIAFEPGYETWELDNIIPVLEQGSNEEEWKVWEYFKKEIVPGLVQEAKDSNRITQLIGIDTADRCIDAATAWILNDKNKKYATKFSSLQEIGEKTNGAENGWTLLYEELKKQIDSLRNAGYGVMALAWTKEKETTLYDGKKYNSVELMMHNTGRKVFESQSHFTCCLFSEVKILNKEGTELKENLKNKKNKEIGTKFHETEVYMYFRPTQYISIAGGRFTTLPEKMLYSADNYLDVFEKAILGQLKKTNKTIEELKIEEQKNKDEKIKNVENKNKIDNKKNNINVENNVEPEEKTVQEQIKEIAKKIRATAKQKSKEGIPMDRIETTVGKNLDFKTVEQAQSILDKLEALKK